MGENIFRLLNDKLSAASVPWNNCLSFAADNASVMIGRRKDVAAFVTETAPLVYLPPHTFGSWKSSIGDVCEGRRAYD